jgi:hypothetical protein
MERLSGLGQNVPVYRLENERGMRQRGERVSGGWRGNG